MKLHGICLVKNEADFLRRSLSYNLQWFDAIYLYDNGSTDGTWDLAREMAVEEPRIIPYKHDGRPFRDHLRGEVFNAFRERAQAGDWWCRLDGDEIYPLDPKLTLKKVPPSHHVIWSAHLQYYFSEADLQRWEANPLAAAQPLPDFADLPRSYVCNWSEERFFKHRLGLVWGETSWPTHVGVVHPRRIPVKHYQYRSPEQIQQRLETRRKAAREGYETFGHSLEADWQEKIVDSARFEYDHLDGNLVIDEKNLPRHLEKLPKRFVKKFMHGCGFWK